MEEEQRTKPRGASLILSILGGGFIFIDLWVLLFLPAFTLSSALILAIIGLLLLVSGLIAKYGSKS